MHNLNISKLADDAYEAAVCYELDYGACPQCVLTAVQEAVGLIEDQTIKASHGLSGGGGLMGEGTCGALVGGLMALSAKRGRDRDKMHKGKYINNFSKARQLVEKFRQEFDGVTCQQLQKTFTGKTYNMWDANEYSQFDKDRGMKCAHASGSVARWVIEML
ncbi:MAG: C-GCAxxG-C-C family protein [Gammaproteobacteria bacterium]|nr:C-GCAxxG-C-C family protein [Gammaproteobacteria bacterium]